MKKREFLEAVTAYLEGRATFPQKYIIDNYYLLFSTAPNITDSLSTYENNIIFEEMWMQIVIRSL